MNLINGYNIQELKIKVYMIKFQLMMILRKKLYDKIINKENIYINLYFCFFFNNIKIYVKEKQIYFF